MDVLVIKDYHIHHQSLLELLHSSSSSITPPPPPPLHDNFPILAFAIVSIFATAFLLVGFYLFVLKSCLTCHHIALLRHFSFTTTRPNDVHPLPAYSFALHNRGLDESVIRSIPLFRFKKAASNSVDFNQGGMFSECAVCLNEFQEDENLRIIPNCSHVFHIDCIDVWLQSNTNCPLCRTTIASNVNANPLFNFPMEILNQSVGNTENFLLIQLQEENSIQERLNSGELEKKISFPRKLEKSGGCVPKYHVSSMGDECIDIRGKDDRFSVQPIRRSFSMDSSNDGQLCLEIQEILKHRMHKVGPVVESSSSSRVGRSFFSLGHGIRGSRKAVLPLHFEP